MIAIAPLWVVCAWGWAVWSGIGLAVDRVLS